MFLKPCVTTNEFGIEYEEFMHMYLQMIEQDSILRVSMLSRHRYCILNHSLFVHFFVTSFEFYASSHANVSPSLFYWSSTNISLLWGWKLRPLIVGQ